MKRTISQKRKNSNKALEFEQSQYILPGFQIDFKQWEVQCFKITWEIGRQFGFQAFNKHVTPGEAGPSDSNHSQLLVAESVFVTATIGLVADHISHLLCHNGLRRSYKDNGDSSQAFSQAVWDLHSKLLLGYFKQWCPHVKLQPRATGITKFIQVHKWDDPIIVYGLIKEISLYLLIWTEVANLRQCPETIWFIFWNIMFAPEFVEFWQQDTSVQKQATSQQILDLRNSQTGFIQSLREKLDVGDRSQPPSELAMKLEMASKRLRQENISENIEFLSDIIVYGDGGYFLDRIVQPFFNVLAYEMQHLATKIGVEPAFRLGYDDMNESFNISSTLMRTLKQLNIPYQTLRKGLPHNGFTQIANLCIYSNQGTEKYNQDLSSNFWRSNALQKTFVERRSWFMVYRSFQRIITVHVLITHALLIIIFSSWKDWRTMTTLVLTHIWLLTFEKFSNIFSTRLGVGPQVLYTRRSAWIHGFVSGSKATVRQNMSEKQLVNLTSNKHAQAVEGKPFLGIFGVIEILVVAIALSAVYVAQYITIPVLSDISGQYWNLIAGGYGALQVVHFIITTRPGYQVSILNFLRLPRILSAMSQITPANYWLSGSLWIGWTPFLLNMFYWLGVFAIKICFDYFLLYRPLKPAILSILRTQWGRLPGDKYLTLFGFVLKPIPVFDFDAVLVGVRLAPILMVAFVNTSLFNSIVLTLYGMIYGVAKLNIGAIGHWSDLMREFHRQPVRWWSSCVSQLGQKHTLAAQADEKQLMNAAALAQGGREAESAILSLSDSSKLVQKKASNRSLLGVLSDDSETQLAAWNTFATVWNSLLEQLHTSDKVSKSELKTLQFQDLQPDVVGRELGIRPKLLPALFYSGQIRRCIDAGTVNGQQLAVLLEFQKSFVWVLHNLNFVTVDGAKIVLSTPFLAEPIDVAHRNSRTSLLIKAQSFLTALSSTLKTLKSHRSGISPSHPKTVDGVVSALFQCVPQLEIECHALTLKALKKRNKTEQAKAAQFKNLVTSLVTDKDYVSARLAERFTELAEEAQDNPKTIQMLITLSDASKDMLATQSGIAMPQSQETRQALLFFSSSLQSPMLLTPPAVHSQPSWSVLTPLYDEEVLYPFDSEEVRRIVGPLAPGQLQDLAQPDGDRVSLLNYLQSVYQQDWENFKSRLGDAIGRDLSSLINTDFAEGGNLHVHQLDVMLWASYRGQLMSRTIRGMMLYAAATELLARLEYPKPTSVSQEEYDNWINQLVDHKFQYILAAQRYSEYTQSLSLRDRWQAESLEILSELFPKLRMAFLHSTPARLCGETCTKRFNAPNRQYAVLACGNGKLSANGGTTISMQRPGLKQLYRVELPAQTYTSRGVIIGEGKSENQNAAIIFAFGECIQTIDMNQDNTLGESLKMRSLLNEVATPPKVKSWGTELISELLDSKRVKSAKDLQNQLFARMYNVQPMAMAGAREFIFSEQVSALGSFAASSEYAFGSIIQRVMAYPAHVRLHYGHPDVMNKLHVITRGGLSKGTRQLHISEDVYGGMNHLLRGGKIVFREYLQVEKGRDMGFNSINSFEIKIAGGAGEMLLSRESFRLGTRLDLFRLFSLYNTGPGYYLNSQFTMWALYWYAYMLLILVLAKATKMDPEYEKEVASPKTNVQTSTIRSEFLVQLGLVSTIPFLGELILQTGVVEALVTLISQAITGSFFFFIFKTQTTAFYFNDSLTFGGASYIGTGRGFSIQHYSFVPTFTNYCRSHMYLALDLAHAMIALAMIADPVDLGSYWVTTWSIWIVVASLFFAPFWFNPMTFSLSKTRAEYRAWRQWMEGELDPDTKSTWHTFNTQNLQKYRNDTGMQTDRWAKVLSYVGIGSIHNVLVVAATVTRVKVEFGHLIPLKYQITNSAAFQFVVYSIVLWITLVCFVYIRTSLMAANRGHLWRLLVAMFAIATVVILTSGTVASYIFLPGAQIVKPFVYLLYANLHGAIIMVRLLLFVGSGPRVTQLVNYAFKITDQAIGLLALGILAVLSVLGFVGKIQNMILFNATFAKSVKKGKLAQTVEGHFENAGKGNKKRLAVRESRVL